MWFKQLEVWFFINNGLILWLQASMTVETSNIQTGVCPWMRPLHTYWYVHTLTLQTETGIASIITLIFQLAKISHYLTRFCSFVVLDGCEILCMMTGHFVSSWLYIFWSAWGEDAVGKPQCHFMRGYVNVCTCTMRLSCQPVVH